MTDPRVYVYDLGISHFLGPVNKGESAWKKYQKMDRMPKKYKYNPDK